MEDRDAPTAGIRHCWRDVRAWCSECDWEVAGSEPSADDARRDARQHVLDTGHGVNIAVHDFYAAKGGLASTTHRGERGSEDR